MKARHKRLGIIIVGLAGLALATALVLEALKGNLSYFFSPTEVAYEGILPDLFAEGQGVIAQGKMGPDEVFVAEEVLAKHDETYMPPEVAEALEAAGKMDQPHPGGKTL